MAQSGLGDFFQWVEIVSNKTPDIYTRTFDRHADGPSRALMVGDSMKSDMVPSLSVGSWAAHVPNGPAWALEQAETPKNHARFVALSSLSEILPLVDEIG